MAAAAAQAATKATAATAGAVGLVVLVPEAVEAAEVLEPPAIPLQQGAVLVCLELDPVELVELPGVLEELEVLNSVLALTEEEAGQAAQLVLEPAESFGVRGAPIPQTQVRTAIALDQYSSHLTSASSIMSVTSGVLAEQLEALCIYLSTEL